MDAELRKRIEDAADIYAKRLWNNLLEVHISKTDFLAGAELGYKEAIAMAKEWLKENIENYIDGFIAINGMITDFETDLTKLWEEWK